MGAIRHPLIGYVLKCHTCDTWEEKDEDLIWKYIRAAQVVSQRKSMGFPQANPEWLQNEAELEDRLGTPGWKGVL